MNSKAWRRRRIAWLVGFGCCCLGIGLVAHPPAFDSIGLKVDHAATGCEIGVGKADEARIERIEKSGVMVQILDPHGTRQQLAVKFGSVLGFGTFEPDVAERKMESIIAQAFPDICGLSRLDELDMGGYKPFGDPHLAALPATWGLRRINLSLTGVTDKGVQELSRHLELESVFVNDTKVTDIGIKSLASLPRLRVLEVSSSRITDSGVENLAKVPSLRQLNLDDTTVSSVGVNFLKGRRLQNFSLKNTRVDDQCVDALASLQGIRVLLLGGTKLSAKSCWLLVRSRAEVLDLSRTGVDDSSLAKIYNPNLETLFLNDTNITDDGLASLRACPTLRSLFVENTKVTEEGVRKLQVSNRKLSISWRSEPEEGYLDIKGEEQPIRINKI